MGWIDKLKAAIMPKPKPWDVKDGNYYNSAAIEAVEQIMDDAVLMEIALNAKNDGARNQAAEQIADRDMLAELARRNDRHVRNGCCNNPHFDDMKRLRSMAVNDIDPFVRLTAARRLQDDQMLLAQVVVNTSDEDEYVLKELLNFIADERACHAIAMNRKDTGRYRKDYVDWGTDEKKWMWAGVPVLEIVVERIQSEDLLREIAQSAACEEAREFAQKKLDESDVD